jgi:hypothetical protein
MGMMGGFGFLLALVAVGIPAAQVLRRVGYNPWWGVLAAIPLVNVVALWVFAFTDWPRLPLREEADRLA